LSPTSNLALEAEQGTQRSRKELFKRLLERDPTGNNMSTHDINNEAHMFAHEGSVAASLLMELSRISKGDKKFYAEAVGNLSNGETIEHSLAVIDSCIRDEYLDR
jgi:hypothetical protein